MKVRSPIDPNRAYDNSIYDKNPKKDIVELCVAGSAGYHTTSDGVRKFRINAVNDAAVTERAVSYEAEHCILIQVDPARYGATQHHTFGSGHPIFNGVSQWVIERGLTHALLIAPENYPEYGIKAGDEFLILLVR